MSVFDSIGNFFGGLFKKKKQDEPRRFVEQPKPTISAPKVEPAKMLEQPTPEATQPTITQTKTNQISEIRHALTVCGVMA